MIDEDTPVLFREYCYNCKQYTDHQMINIGSDKEVIMACLCTKCDHIS